MRRIICLMTCLFCVVGMHAAHAIDVNNFCALSDIYTADPGRVCWASDTVGGDCNVNEPRAGSIARVFVCQCGTVKHPYVTLNNTSYDYTNYDYNKTGHTLGPACPNEYECEFEYDLSAAGLSTNAFCIAFDERDQNSLTGCKICGCEGDVVGAWETDSNNRVKRLRETHDSAEFSCTVGTSTTEYGCAAGYYQSSGSGASMVCTKCPEPKDTDGITSQSATNCVTSAIGNTGGISACHASTECLYTDVPGTFVFTSACSASN